jgi:NinB protein
VNRRTITIRGDHDRKEAINAILAAGSGMRVEIKEKKRSGLQNDLMWPLLRDVSDQVDWYGEKLSPTDWKDVFTASLVRARVVRNIDGDGFVQIGLHTSDLGKDEMSNLIELIRAFGAQHNVQFSEPDSPGADRPADASGVLQGAPPPSTAPDAEISALSDDWRHTYLDALAAPKGRAESLKTRHHQAEQMLGGAPSEREKAWMRLAWRLVEYRDKGRLQPGEFEKMRADLLAGELPPERDAA